MSKVYDISRAGTICIAAFWDKAQLLLPELPERILQSPLPSQRQAA